MSKTNIIFCNESLQKAAEYIWNNNRSVKVWPSKPKSVQDVVKDIRETMITTALKNADVVKQERRLGVKFDDQWCGYIGTGGYYLSFSHDDYGNSDIVIHIDILVDMSVGVEDKDFATETIEVD